MAFCELTGTLNGVWGGGWYPAPSGLRWDYLTAKNLRLRYLPRGSWEASCQGEVVVGLTAEQALECLLGPPKVLFGVPFYPIALGGTEYHTGIPGPAGLKTLLAPTGGMYYQCAVSEGRLSPDPLVALKSATLACERYWQRWYLSRKGAAPGVAKKIIRVRRFRQRLALSPDWYSTGVVGYEYLG